MPYFLNRLTLRLHGGAAATAELAKDARGHLDRMLLAKQLGHLLGCTGFRLGSSSPLSLIGNIRRRLAFDENKEFILGLEKRLRFLENRGAIRIQGETIYFKEGELECRDEGRGEMDQAVLTRTLLTAVSQANEEVWGNSGRSVLPATQLSERVEALLVKASDLGELPAEKAPLGFFASIARRIRESSVKRWLWNPQLHFEAADLAAAITLKRKSRRRADTQRRETATQYPTTQGNIALIDNTMKRIREMLRHEILELFEGKQEATRVPALTSEHKFAVVVSDTHIGPHKHEKTDDLLRTFALALILKTPLILNGDFLDLWQYRASLKRIEEANPLIFEAIRSGKIQIKYVLGNHDRDLAAMDQAERRAIFGDKVEFIEGGVFYQERIWIEHGHQSDPHNVDDAHSGSMLAHILTFLADKTSIPNLMRWAEFCEAWGLGLYGKLYRLGHPSSKRDFWRERKIDAIIRRIKAVVMQLSAQGHQFDQAHPLVFMRGHDHGLGYTFTLQEIQTRISADQELVDKVEYHPTGSWTGEDQSVNVLDFSFPERVYDYPYERKTYPKLINWNPPAES